MGFTVPEDRVNKVDFSFVRRTDKVDFYVPEEPVKLTFLCQDRK